MGRGVIAVYILGSLLVACGGRAEDDPRPDAAVAVHDAGPPEGDAGRDDAGGDDAGGDAVDASVATDPDAGATPDGGPIATDAGPPDAGRVCGVGALCNDANPCAGDMRCYGFGGDGFCAPFAPECGGFVMTECTGGRRCIRGGGGSIGYCATADEAACICDSAREHDITTDGCS